MFQCRYCYGAIKPMRKPGGIIWYHAETVLIKCATPYGTNNEATPRELPKRN